MKHFIVTFPQGKVCLQAHSLENALLLAAIEMKTRGLKANVLGYVQCPDPAKAVVHPAE